jgi:hypothetical protein
VEEAIVAYRREESARLAHEMPAKDSTVATVALLAPKLSRTGATNTGKPRLTAVLFRELRKPPNQTIHHP